MKQAPLTSQTRPGATANDGAPAPPKLEACSAAIDDGLLMVFGPEGDPLPPPAFGEAALAQPEATMIVAGEAVPVARMAAVLDAQSRQRLAPPAGDAWLRSMLGLGPAPEDASATELAWDGRVELIRFAHELVITTSAGHVFLLRAARPDDAEAGVQASDAAGAAISHEGLLGAVASDAALVEQPVVGSVVDCAGTGLLLNLPENTIRIAPAGSDASSSVPCTSSGESVNWPAFARALLGAPPDWAPPAQAQGEPDRQGAGLVSADVPERLVFDAQGFVDLDWLGRALAPFGGQVAGILLKGLPAGVRISAGSPDDEGWRIQVDDLPDLVMFATPEDLRDFTLEVEVDGRDAPQHWSIPVVSELEGEDEVRPQAPLTVVLEFPPPFSPRNRLDYFAVLMIEGLPPGATLSAGVPTSSSRWTLAPDDLRGLRVHLPAGVSLPCRVEVIGITIENREGMLSSARRALIIGAGNDGPDDDPPPAVAAIDLSPLLEAAGPDRRIEAVALSGLPPVIALTSGMHDRVSNCWVLRSNELSGVTITVRDPALRRLSIKARAIVTDGSGRATAISQSLGVEIPEGSSAELKPVTSGPGFFRPLADRRA